MTSAMLLCAGHGTRLGELSCELPKPLLPVCGIPIVRYGIALLVGHGISDIVINLHHKGDLIAQTLGDGSQWGARIRYSEEPELLGTGGGLKHALPLLAPDGDDELIVSMNGKLIFDLDVTALLQASQHRPEALGTMVVREVGDADEWGAVDARTDHQGRFNVHNVFAGGRHMFCGVHTTRPSVLRRLPDGEACSIRQGYLPWMRDGQPVAAFDATGAYFAEHSTAERYLNGNIAMLETKLRFPPGDTTGADDSANVHPSAQLLAPYRIDAGATVEAGATVGPHAVIGQDATVTADADIARSVVWAGARASGQLDGCIVTPNSVVQV